MQSQIVSKMEKNQSLLIHVDDLRGRYSVSEFISLMPSQLSVSDQKSISHLMIFCSQDESIQFNNNKGIAAIKEKIKSALEGLGVFLFPTLVQLWMPKTIGTQQLLVTSDLPFGISLLTEGLCLYRKRCLEHRYDLDCQEELGPVGRVFRNGVSEFSPYVSCYSSKEFKLRDAAVRCGVNGYLALPVFESVRDQCVGVLELITSWDGNYYFTDAIGKVIDDAFKAVGLRICDAHLSLHKDRISQHEFDLSQIENGLNAFCHAHCIRFAQTWFTSTGENHNESVMCTSERGSVMSVKKVSSFQKDCIQFGLKKGQSVVWSAFTSGASCFCKDVKQLSIDEYPLVLSARKVNLTGSFAVCLQSRSTGNEVYVLEFFLCPYQPSYGKPQTLLKAFLAAVQQNFQSFKVASVQESGADTPLNIIKLDRLDESLEMCATTGSQPLLRFSHNNCENVRTQDNLPVLQNNEDMVKAPGVKVPRNQSRRQLEDAEFVIHEEKQLCRERSIDRQTNKRKADHSLSHEDARGSENHNKRTRNRDQARSDLPPDEGTTSVSHPAAPAPENEGTIMIKAAFKEGMIKFPLSLSSGMMDFEKEVTKRLNLTTGSFEIKYQNEDNNYILVSNDVDLQKLMFDMMSKRKNTVKVLLEPTENQHLEISRGSVGSPMLQINPVQNESIKAPPAPENEGTIMIKASFKEDMIKFPLSLSSGIMDFEKEVTKRLNLTTGSFEIKYQNEDNNYILVSNDVDLQKLMFDMMSQRKNTIKVLLEPTQNQHLGSSRDSVGSPMLQINPVQNESIKAPPAPENEGTIMIKAAFKEDMIKFPLSLSSGIMDFEKEVTKRLNLTTGSFEIKYQKEDNNCILVSNDVDLQKLMFDMMSQRKNTIKVLLEPTQNQHLESSRGSVGSPMLQINPVHNESIKAPPAPENEGTIMIKASFKEDMIKFPLSLSSGIMDFEKEVTKRLNLTTGSFEIKYQKEDNNYILVSNDVDLQKLMFDMVSQRKNTIKVLLEPTQNQHLESSRDSVGSPMLQINPVQNERIMTIKATYKEETVELQVSLSSKLMELKNEVMKQFKLSGDSFDIKCLAEPNEWIPLTSDNDLHNCVTIMKPQENPTIRLAVEPCTNQIPEEVATSASPPMPQAMTMQNESLMTIKATYKEVMIKFQLSLSSGLMQLRDAIKKRLNLSGESYEIKYQDVNNNWICLSRDADLQSHLRAMRSSDRSTVRLHIEPLKT
ncbi:protein NLP6-like isoform X2 [Coffea arabica]|uniref:Protein NLP6-like isoform X2 n=1 Tax=Coffea arabica TaxID=13443 RepID=A0A6P6SPN1_COFAR